VLQQSETPVSKTERPKRSALYLPGEIGRSYGITTSILGLQAYMAEGYPWRWRQHHGRQSVSLSEEPNINMGLLYLCLWLNM